MHRLHWKETIIFFLCKIKKYRHLIGPVCSKGRRMGNRSHFLSYTYCFMYSKLLSGKKMETYWIHFAVNVLVAELRGWISKLKKTNIMLFLSQSDCPGRRLSAPEPTQEEKKDMTAGWNHSETEDGKFMMWHCALYLVCSQEVCIL